MAEDLRIDSHKLILHPQRVAQWLVGENVYPITIEISPSGACNHRCRFCAFDYLGYQPAFLEPDLMLKNLTQMAEKGVKAIVVAGEGEPLLNKATPDLIRRIKGLGMDASLVSNGVLFTENVAEACLSSLSWARFSINAGTETTHHLIHGGRPNDFSIILDNLRKAVAIKKRDRLGVTLGVQLLLLPENQGEAVDFGKILKEIGVDYYTVKPYSQHPKSINQAGSGMDYQQALDLEKQLSEVANQDFQVYFRAHSMQKKSQQRQYPHCLGLPFWTYLDSQANLWACIAYVGDRQFCYGNLHEQSFAEIWEGPKRQALEKYVADMDISNCRELCRLDEINNYLHQLRHPNGHVNFI